MLSSWLPATGSISRAKVLPRASVGVEVNEYDRYLARRRRKALLTAVVLWLVIGAICAVFFYLLVLGLLVVLA